MGQLDHDIHALNKGNDSSRKQALHSLKERKESEWADASPAAVDSVVEALRRHLLSETTPPAVRQEIVTILGKIGPRSVSALPQIIDMLKDGVPDAIRESVAKALGKIGRESKGAVDQLIKLLSHSRAALVVQAARALGDIGCADQRVRTALSNIWLSPVASQNVQLEAAIALCKLKVDVEGLLRFLTGTLATNQEVSRRKSAAEALSFCNKNELDVVPALLTAVLKDKNDEVRQTAQTALDQLGVSQDKAIQLCAKQLKDSAYAETALRKSGLPAVAALIKAVASDDAAVREKAVRILGGLGEIGAAAAPALTKALQDKEMEIRLESAKALWNVSKSPDLVVPVLVELLEEKWVIAEDTSEARRRFLQTVIEALWRIGPPAKAAIPALAKKAKDKNRLVSETAISALKEIEPKVANKAVMR